MNTIDYYYAPISGYAYLGEERLVELAKRSKAVLNFKPVDIAKVFASSNTIAPFKQSGQRLAYRMRDMQRIANAQGLVINPKPRYWPVPVAPASKLVYAAMEYGIDPHVVSFSILRAVYAQERDVSQPETLKEILQEVCASSADSEALYSLSQQESVEEQFNLATTEAINLGVFGSPTYVLNQTDLFFGQDRLSMLGDYL